MKEVQELSRLLGIYQTTSGQKINLSKSELSFSRNVDSSKKEQIYNILLIPIVDKIKKYLGFLTYMER